MGPGSCGYGGSANVPSTRGFNTPDGIISFIHFSLSSFVCSCPSPSSNISPGQPAQPQHKHALWRLREIAFNQINFLGGKLPVKRAV